MRATITRSALPCMAIACGLWLGSLGSLSADTAPEPLRVEFVSVAAPSRMQAGQRYAARVTIRNTGTATWTPDVFRLSYHWAAPDGTPVIRDGERTGLPRTVAPDREIALCATILAPPDAGTYLLQWDLVQEGVTWFSAANPQNSAVQQVSVSPAVGGLSSTTRIRDLARLQAFLVVTLGHFALVAFWVWRVARPSLRNLDEYVFFATVFGFGSLQAVLHALASSIGISLTAGALTLLGLHALTAGWVVRRHGRRELAATEAQSSAPRDSFALPWLAVPGVVILIALFLQWYGVTAQSLRVTGTDAAHYHIPHAVNFARGANLFGFVATPHLYPMGTSIWAAWLLQPLEGPALLDLVTLPALLLLIVSIGLLGRVTTGASGLVWAPWLVLVMLTAPLLRISLLPSADLLYAAAFVALFTQCCVVWRTGTVRSVDLVSAALCGGLLLGSKTMGVMSAVLIGAVFAVLLAGRRLGRWKQGLAWQVTPTAIGFALLAVVLPGGIWLVRNWLFFGSPLAPSGLTVAGFTVFPGDAYMEGGYYNSVLKDLRDLGGYSLASRFAFYARRLLGTWFLPISLLLGILLIDVLGEWRRRRTLTETTAAKLWLLLTTVILALLHVALLVPAPWTSLEWTRGLALRYVLPFLVLYMALMGFCLFSTELPKWHRVLGSSAPIGLAAMALATGVYALHGSVPQLPKPEWFPVLDWGMISVAAAVVLSWHVFGRFGRRGRLLAAVPLLAAVAWLSYRIVMLDGRLMAASRAIVDQRTECGVEGLAQENEHRCVYLHAVAYERRHRVDAGQRRFFVASRFDFPLELQGPELENLVFDVSGRTELPQLLRTRGPGTSSRDYLVIDAREVDAGRSARLAYRVASEAGIELVGACGRYQVYRVRAGQ
jgi:hypothetical protein